jgi:menaquinone-dependent protoporphyrinogen IX oxidase
VIRGGISPSTKAKYTIKNPPDLSEFDAVLVGGPVWAFKASPVIMKYLVEDVQKLKGKKAMAFVTMVGYGGDRALKMMNEELEASAADVLEGEKLKCFFKFKAGVLEGAVERVCKKLGA